MKIYFSGDQNSSVFHHLTLHLRQFGDILTPSNLEGRIKYDSIIHGLATSDVHVFEISHGGMNLGYELGRSVERVNQESKKPILCLFDRSYMEVPSICSSLENCFGYTDIDEAKKAVDFFFKSIKDN